MSEMVEHAARAMWEVRRQKRGWFALFPKARPD